MKTEDILELVYRSLQWRGGEITGWNKKWLEGQLYRYEVGREFARKRVVEQFAYLRELHKRFESGEIDADRLRELHLSATVVLQRFMRICAYEK